MATRLSTPKDLRPIQTGSNMLSNDDGHESANGASSSIRSSSPRSRSDANSPGLTLSPVDSDLLSPTSRKMVRTPSSRSTCELESIFEESEETSVSSHCSSLSLAGPLSSDILALRLVDGNPLNTLYVSQSNIPFYKVTTTAKRRDMTTCVKRIQPSLSSLTRKIHHGRRHFLDGKRHGIGGGGNAEASMLEEELVATIEWKQTLLLQTPKDAHVTLNIEGAECYHVPASKYLKRRWPFSSTRVFRTTAGEDCRWNLASLTPKLYNARNERLAKYSRPHVPSGSALSSKEAVIEVSNDVSMELLDEIIISFVSTTLL
ncbi:hypothetical protein SCHPADRAFT_947248 [Schizopora paradoxa]|uniref:DUF6593 domain-containing protein n=1 Tax=Schizopora paradoxa TaxID=27342 RepID=A0A0H2R163_9AGAM|nr:hypothetical protein SCHPADRAFT_947248 [Schizopora paradoxa]